MPRKKKEPAVEPSKEVAVIAAKNPYAEEPVSTKSSQTFELFRDSWFGYKYDGGQEPIDELVKKFGESSTWVYIAIKRIADAVAQIPLMIMSGTSDKPSVIRGYDKGLAALLNRPNPWQSWFDFAEALMVSLELTGNGFIELVYDENTNKPYEMYLLNPARMTVIPKPKAYIAGYVYSVNGKSIPFAPEEIIHIKYHHPNNDYYGFSPMTAARISIDVDQSSLEWNQNFLLRGAWPAGALETEGDIADDELKRLQRQVRLTMQRGKDQAGRILVLSGGLKYHQLGITPKDAEWMSARRMSRDEILAIFGVPFAVAGLFSTEQTTARSAGVEQQIKQFYRTTIFSKVEKVLGALNRQLVPLFRNGIVVTPNYRSIPALQEEVDQELTRSMALRTLVSAGLSLNKALARLYPDIESEAWGDVAWMNQSQVPIDSPQSNVPSNNTLSNPTPTDQLPDPNAPAKALFEEDVDSWERICQRVRLAQSEVD